MALCIALQAHAYQIAPLGSSFEASLTNESESTLARIAQRIGSLIKLPVHEEITQLGFSCPADTRSLLSDTSCGVRDAPFATPYVIYGVRWNDLPPFRMSAGEGASCKKFLTRAPACRADQTVRFATQPECWACLFRDAQGSAQTKKIAGCKRGADVIGGNLMTRSHFGDLQFLHAMATEAGVAAEVTRAEILDWTEFAWKVAVKELGPDVRMRDVPLATLQERFGCSEWTVADIYILGRNDKLRPMLHRIAFGSLLHVLQDSFSAAHVDREPPVGGETCPAAAMAQPGRVREFHTYAAQDSTLHDGQDSRDLMAASAVDRWPDAIEVTRTLFALYDGGSRWDAVRPVIDCVFSLSADKRPSSPGDAFRRASR